MRLGRITGYLRHFPHTIWFRVSDYFSYIHFTALKYKAILFFYLKIAALVAIYFSVTPCKQARQQRRMLTCTACNEALALRDGGSRLSDVS